jgi:tRNA (adenine57-N1/adenine58-N1)-methyltransferase
MASQTVSPGDLVLVIVESGDRRREYFFRASHNAVYTTIAGVLPGHALIGKPWGSRIDLQNGRAYLLPPTLRDLQEHYFRRVGQVIYPKDLGYIIVSTGLRCGMKVLEAGVGSGFLTSTLASILCCGGKLIGYDVRQDALDAVERNLRIAGLQDCVELRLGDVREGVPDSDLDAVFLDLPDPWNAAKALWPSLKPGAPLIVFLPTYNQVEKMASAAPQLGYVLQETVELLLREVEARPGAVRPSTRMVGHTGFILLLRRLFERPMEAS